MLILNELNEAENTDQLNREVYYSVLSFKNFQNPDFYFEKLTQIEEFSAPCISMEIGPFRIVVPFIWSILCSDREYIQAIQLIDIAGLEHEAFCLNPLDGYIPSYLKIRMREPFPNAVWTCPPIDERNMLVVPLGKLDKPNTNKVDRGPICAIFSPNRIDVTRSIADIL